MRLSLIFLTTLLLISCGGGGGSSSTTEGITMRFTASLQASQAADGSFISRPAGSKIFTNTEGVQITLNMAYFTMWSVTIETDCNQPSFSLLDVLFPAAHAHADDTPTRSATPNVIDLLAADSDVVALGETGPPPADYCGVTVELLQADDDAQYLPEDIEMIDRSVYLEGTYQLAGNSEAMPFVIDTGRALREAKRRYATPVTLSASNLNAETRLQIHYDRWFDGVDFNNLADQQQQDWILNQITESIRVAG